MFSFFWGHCWHVILRGKHFLAAHFLFPSNNSNVERVEKKTIAERGLAFTFKRNDFKIMNENRLSEACAKSLLLQVCVVLFSLLMRSHPMTCLLLTAMFI